MVGYLDGCGCGAADGAVHLEIAEIKFPNNLSPGRTIGGDYIDGEVNSLEGPFVRSFHRDHGG